jgi:hypothetical protein
MNDEFRGRRQGYEIYTMLTKSGYALGRGQPTTSETVDLT